MSNIYKHRGWSITTNPKINTNVRIVGNCKSWVAIPPKEFPVKIEGGMITYLGLEYTKKQIDRFIKMIENDTKNKKENDHG